MSELLDSYAAQMPEKCLTCPVFAGFLAAAAAHEADGRDTANTMLQFAGSGPFDLPKANDIWRTLHAELLEMSTEDEVAATKNVARLAEHGQTCPTPKRGGVPHEALVSRIVSWLANKQVCQNPGLKDLAA